MTMKMISDMPAEAVAIKAILWWGADLSLRDELAILVEVAEAALATGSERIFDIVLTQMVALLGATTAEEVFKLNDYLDWLCRSNIEKYLDRKETSVFEPSTNRVKVKPCKVTRSAIETSVENSQVESPVVVKTETPKKPKKEPKNHQTKEKEKSLDLSLEARKRRLAKLRKANREGSADGRMDFFSSTF